MASISIQILVIVLLLLSLRYIYCYYHYISKEQFSSHVTQNICILLTAHLTDDNIDMYLLRIKRWLAETPFDIYFVDSGNRGFNISHPRFHPFLFDQTRESYYSIHKGNLTMLEKMSIQKSLAYFQLDKKYEYIYKITGKYFIPNWLILTQIPKNTEFVIQHRFDSEKSHQNSELFAVNKDIMGSFFNSIPNDQQMEWYLNKVRSYYRTYRLPKINLDVFTKRSDGMILNYL